VDEAAALRRQDAGLLAPRVGPEPDPLLLRQGDIRDIVALQLAVRRAAQCELASQHN
jgi:hypothetical protein